MTEREIVDGKVAILGTGREGQAAWRYLRSRHPAIELTLIDEAPVGPEFASQMTDLDKLIIGPLAEAGLEKFDVLVRSPGISVYRASIQAALAAGVELTSPSSLWFSSHAQQNTICVTGTKGKSTTSALLAHMLSACGYRVQLAGNIGMPLLECDDRDVDWWVIELSSYQLADLVASPGISVILNLEAEHLDWHGSENRYRRDKMRLVELAEDRLLIANAADSYLAGVLATRADTRWFNDHSSMHTEGQHLYNGNEKLAVDMPEGLPGAHNLSNAAAALTVVQEIGADISTALESISTFRPLSHRLQMLGTRAGIRFIDDSISSAPVATLAALEALPGQKVTLIAGGLDRGVDWSPYMLRLSNCRPAAIIAVPDNGSRIIASVQAAGIQPPEGLHFAQDLAAAVSLARELTSQGGVVLLSPGAPSFPHFRDYRDRGCQFAAMCGFEPDESGLAQSQDN